MKTIIVFLIVIMSFLFCGCPSQYENEYYYSFCIGTWDMQTELVKEIKTNIPFNIINDITFIAIIYDDDQITAVDYQEYNGNIQWYPEDGFLYFTLKHTSDVCPNCIFINDKYNNLFVNRGIITVYLQGM